MPNTPCRRYACAATSSLLLASLLALPAWSQEPYRQALLPPLLSPELSLSPPLPALQLTPPLLLDLRPVIAHPHAPWLSYWRAGALPREWRDVPDSEVRLRLETGELRLDDASLSTGLRTTPERERECHPNCWGADWESSVIFKYEVGSIGPLERAGPMLEMQGKPHGSGVRSRGLFNIGLIGAF